MREFDVPPPQESVSVAAVVARKEEKEAVTGS